MSNAERQRRYRKRQRKEAGDAAKAAKMAANRERYEKANRESEAVAEQCRAIWRKNPPSPDSAVLHLPPLTPAYELARQVADTLRVEGIAAKEFLEAFTSTIHGKPKPSLSDSLPACRDSGTGTVP